MVVPRPKEASVAADKMNVLYRGLENPMTISFAGVSELKFGSYGGVGVVLSVAAYCAAFSASA